MISNKAERNIWLYPKNINIRFKMWCFIPPLHNIKNIVAPGNNITSKPNMSAIAKKEQLKKAYFFYANRQITWQNQPKQTPVQYCWTLFDIFPATAPRERQKCVNRPTTKQSTKCMCSINFTTDNKRTFDGILAKDQLQLPHLVVVVDCCEPTCLAKVRSNQNRSSFS